MPIPDFPTLVRGRSKQANAIGSVASVLGLTVEERGGDILRQTLLRFTDYTLAIPEISSLAGGSQLLYTFPTCAMEHRGTTGRISGSLAAAADGIVQIGFGTAADADASLANEEIDIAPNTTIIASGATSGTGSFVCQAPIGFMDGSGGAFDIYLNAVILGNTTGTKTLTLNGWALVTWTNLGDPNLS